jgi:acetoin utilization deacetylase AcuC-like enzyme
MLPFKLIYHPGYDLNLGAHVFPSQKYRLVQEALLAEGIAEASDFIAPAEALDADILRVHDADYIQRLRENTLGFLERAWLEIPFSPETRRAFWLAAGGSILAGQLAMRDGWAVNIGGGFHHAFPDHGEGFCAIHDVAIALRRLQHDREIRQAMIVDADVHHGNGTAAIFAGDPSVFTLSIHQRDNYPESKPPSNVDIHLPDGTDDTGYYALLDHHLTQAFHEFTPDLIFYVAGADPYLEDQLGGLSLTMEGLKQRDALVFEHARRHSAAVAIVLAGGYARRVEDTVRIHLNTIIAAQHAARRKSTASQ